MSDQHRPYIVVAYSAKNKGQYGTIEEVQAALPKDVEGLQVDESFGYPSVTFTPGTPYATMKQVADHLRGQGFEVDL